jgi:uncharacterized cupredoxin-like copper-binding protein
LAVGLVMVGCGGGGGDTKTTDAASALGAPGDASKATRTVEVRAGDDLHFQPDQLQAKVGETVTFRLVNVAKIPHDLVLGDEAAQTAHEKEMRSMGSGASMDMGGDTNAIHAGPGETKELTWTFSKAGTTLFGCHEAGHYAAGMKGTLTVT